MIDLAPIQDMAADRGLDSVRYEAGDGEVVQVKAADAILVFVQVADADSAYFSSWGSGLAVVAADDLIFAVDQALSDFPF